VYTINDLEVIKILKNNEVYRYGDVYKRVNKICDFILQNNIYNDTILKEWLKIPKGKNKDENETNLYKASKDYFLKNLQQIHEDGDVTIHIRAGDDYMNRGLGNVKIHSQLMCDIKLEDNKKKINKIYLVTALHYGVAHNSTLYKCKKHKYHYTNENKIRNLDKILIFMNEILKLKIDIEIVSNDNIDRDFVFLCFSPRLITTGGGFSQLALAMNKKFKHDATPSPSHPTDQSKIPPKIEDPVENK
jgi:hypothetical protein